MSVYSFYQDELTFLINENNEASAKLSNNITSEKLVVPSEIEGLSVTSFHLAFSEYSYMIKYVTLPASVRNFSGGGVGWDHSVELEIDENNPYLYSDGKAVYTKDRSELIFFTARGDEEYTIRPECRIIRKDAFTLLKKLKKIVFPDGLEIIEYNAFSYCNELSELELPEGLVRIGTRAFASCPKLKKISLPSSLEYIGNEAFAENSNTFDLYLPEGIKTLGESAFPKHITCILSEKNKNFISRDGFILSGDGHKLVCPAKAPESGVLIIPEYIVEICPHAFHNNDMINSIVFPKSLRMIGDHAFAYARQIKELDIENVGYIGSCAFEGCTSLKKIRIRCGNIGDCAFSGCVDLTEADVDCQSTGHSMFKECVKLQMVVLKNTKVLSKETFLAATGLKEVVFPPELEAIENRAFASSGIDTLIIPETVRHIGANAADHVTKIHICDNIETDIDPDNDLSSSDYTLYVHSAKTGDIKYAVPVIGDNFSYSSGPVMHREIVGMFNGGVSFDFKKYDNYFKSLEIDFEQLKGSLAGVINDEMTDKFNSGLIRLKYAYELDDRTRKMYEKQLGELSFYMAEFRTDTNDTGILFDRDFYKYMGVEDVLSLIDITAQKHLAELTAFLMEICNEKRHGRINYKN